MELTPRTISEQVDHADAETCLKMLTVLVPPPVAQPSIGCLLRPEGHPDIGICSAQSLSLYSHASTETLRHVVKCHLLALEVNS